MTEKISVAIIGGGLMGCTLANGLLQYPNIDWHIFEGKSTFVERGAAVGFRDNGTKALVAMGLDYKRLYERSGAVVSDGSHAMVAYGVHKGKTVSKLPAGHINFMRTTWLEELLAPLPQGRLHADKKLASVQQPESTGGLYSLTFDDGSTHSAHLVIGSDGIHSAVRKLVLVDHPDLIAPRFGGYWDARGSTTPQEAARRFGNDLFDPTKSSEIALIGQGAFMLFCPIENGSQYMVIVSAVARSDFDMTSWKNSPDRDFLENAFQDWDRSFRDAVMDCILASGPGIVFSQWMTPETPTYCKGPGLCITGDAAHAVLPFLGNGAAMALEDAAVLSRLLGASKTPSDVWPAIQTFDWAQRERSERLVKLSVEAAKLMTGQLGLDPNDFASRNPDKWWTDIIDTDVERIVQDAVAHFERVRSAAYI